MIRYEIHRQGAARVFDLEDRFARDRGTRGPHPRPLGRVTFRLLAEIVGNALRPFDSQPELEVRRNGGGYDVFFDILRLSDGTRRRGGLSGTYAVGVESEFYQAVERDDVLIPQPDQPYGVALEPGYAYPFPTESTRGGSAGVTLLRGSVPAVDGRGMAGVTVEVTGKSNSYRTDASGQWVLVFPDTQPAEQVDVHFTLPDGTVTNVAAVQVTPGRETSLPPTGLRGSVLTDRGLAIAGARIQVTGQPMSSASDRNGGFFFYFGLDQPPAVVTAVDVTATLPDGRTQTRPTIPIQRRATVVVPAFRFAQL